MNITKTTCVSGTLCHHDREEIALVASTGHGFYNVMPSSQLAQRMGATPRCCAGQEATDLFVKVLASEWAHFRR